MCVSIQICCCGLRCRVIRSQRAPLISCFTSSFTRPDVVAASILKRAFTPAALSHSIAVQSFVCDPRQALIHQRSTCHDGFPLHRIPLNACSSPVKCTSVPSPENTDVSQPATVQSTAPPPNGNLSSTMYPSPHHQSPQYSHVCHAHKRTTGVHTLCVRQDALFVTMLSILRMEKEREPEIWKRLHIGGVNKIKLSTSAGVGNKSVTEALGVPGKRDLP